MPPPRKNGGKKVLNAFTLAEVLITLGIIGVVAALTLPTLIADKKGKELETRYKKMYSIMQQALQKMYFDEGVPITYENYPNPTVFLDKFRSYFIQYVPCSKDRCDGMSVEESGLKLSKVYTTYNGKTNLDVGYFDDTSTIISDGVEIMTNGDYRTYGINLTIDINGYRAKPNKWGQDLFSFQMVDGKLLPMGADGTVYYGVNLQPDTYCSYTMTNARNGLTCAAKALSDESYFKHLP